MKFLLLLLCVVAVSRCTPPKVTTGLLPVCVRNLIAKYQQAPKENPPRKVYSYTYKGETMYYVTAACCDMYSELYDVNCKLLGHPDGGITGKGDGTLPDFYDTRSKERVVWEDKR